MKVLNLNKDVKLIGFFVVFLLGIVQPAWATDNCGYDPRNDKRISAKQYASWGQTLIFGGRITRTSGVTTGKGQCSLCHKFDPNNTLGRGPNLFGIEERSHKRIKEWRYMTHLDHHWPTGPLYGYQKRGEYWRGIYSGNR